MVEAAAVVVDLVVFTAVAGGVELNPKLVSKDEPKPELEDVVVVAAFVVIGAGGGVTAFVVTGAGGGVTAFVVIGAGVTAFVVTGEVA